MGSVRSANPSDVDRKGDAREVGRDADRSGKKLLVSSRQVRDDRGGHNAGAIASNSKDNCSQSR